MSAILISALTATMLATAFLSGVFGMAGGLSLWLGAGAGLIKAVGSPTFRIFLGAQYR